MDLLRGFFVLLYLAILSQCDEETVSHSASVSRSQLGTPVPTNTQSLSTESQSSSFPLPASQSPRSSAPGINHSTSTSTDAVQSDNTSSPSEASLQPVETASAQFSQHPTVTPYSDASSDPPDASQDPVFIPIKEWKRRKLHDIELRVKKFQEAEDSSATHLSSGPDETMIAQPFLIYMNPLCNSLVLFLRSQTCSIFEEQAVRLRSATSAPATSEIPSSTSRTHPPSKTDIDEQPSSRHTSAESLHASQVGQATYSSPGEVSITPTENLLLPSRYAVNEQKDELTAWIEISSTFVASLHRVADIVKLVKEMSLSIGVSHFLFNFPHQNTFSTNDKLSRNPISLFPNGSDTEPGVTLWGQLNVSNSSNQSTLDQSDSAATIASTRGSDQENLTFIEQFQQSNTSSEKPYNFASVDSGARVLLSSKGTIGAKNILDNNVDKYLLVPCGEGDNPVPRWVDIELSEEVILERLQTGNFEYYSSSPTKIVILGSVTYPPNKWQLLGMFKFADVKSLQMFSIEKRVVTRYLRVLFVGKQGREYYCPISTVTAYGKTLIADWKDALNQQIPLRRVENSRNPTPHGTNPGQSSKQKTENTFSSKPTMSHRVSGDDSNTASHNLAPNENDVNVSEHESDDSNSKHVGESQTGVRAGQTESSSTGERQSPSGIVFSQVADDRHRNQGTTDTEDGMSEEDRLVLEAVHADTLDQSSADDNVFRKVTRMLRLLELNQTLTNQYIDTQLAKFANVIQILQTKTDSVHKERGLRSSELQEQIDSLRDVIIDIRNENRLKGVLIVVLLFVTCVLSSFLIAVRISSAATGVLNTQRLVGGEHGAIMKDDSSGQEPEEESDREQHRQISRNQRRRKARRKRKNGFEGPMEGATDTTHLNGSVTPTESSARSTFTSFVGTL